MLQSLSTHTDVWNAARISGANSRLLFVGFRFLVQVAVLHIENVFGFISVNCAVHYVKLYKYFFFQN